MLEREDDEDGAGDRENPVEKDARAVREPREELGERIVRATADREGREVLGVVRRGLAVARILRRRWADGGLCPTQLRS